MSASFVTQSSVTPNSVTPMRTAWGWGLASVDSAGATLDVWYPHAHLGRSPDAGGRPAHGFGSLVHERPDARGVRRVPVFTESTLDAPIRDAADAYLRLHLLSLRLAKPNTMNLDGIFQRLANVAWTNVGPAGVRIADGDQIRLGAYLAPGTTVMHSGSVNYNAGTLGECMVEGRIAQGVVVGDHSDIGVNATTIGTLSGGGRHRVSIGEHTLLGAQSGVGISLGDDCVVEAGLYVTPGTKVSVPDGDGQPARVVKAIELSGRSHLLFLRNSVTGAVEARPRKRGIELNEQLHRN